MKRLESRREIRGATSPPESEEKRALIKQEYLEMLFRYLTNFQQLLLQRQGMIRQLPQKSFQRLQVE